MACSSSREAECNGCCNGRWGWQGNSGPDDYVACPGPSPDDYVACTGALYRRPKHSGPASPGAWQVSPRVEKSCR